MPKLQIQGVDLALIVETRCRECRVSDYRSARLRDVPGGEVRATVQRWRQDSRDCPACGGVATVLPDAKGGWRARTTRLRLRVGDRLFELGGATPR